MTHGMGDRLKALRNDLGLNTSEMAEKVGLKDRSSWERYERRTNAPSGDVLHRLFQLEYNVNWVLSGAGGMKVENVGTNPDSFIKLPRYNARLAAGDGAFNERAELLDYIPFTKEFLSKNLGLMNAKDLAILEVKGDSMEPTISNGDLVIVDQAQRAPEDGIMAFILDDTAYIKRMRRFFDGIEIISDNKELYSPTLLSRDRFDELHIIGRVRWCGHVM